MTETTSIEKNNKSTLDLNRSLSEVEALKNRPPFDGLHTYLLKSVKSPDTDSQASSLPNAIPELGPNILQLLLNHSLSHFGDNPDMPLSFVAEDAMDANSLYYETFIAVTKTVPTRRNWHDFYNGLVWLQFPQTKALFNQYHQQEINLHGRRSRSAVRDKLTHFDECGLVLITDQVDLHDEISEHNWQQVFVERKHQWHENIKPIIFGHALWEMLMQPFIGLTAKVTIIENSALLNSIEQYQSTPNKHSSSIDQELSKHIINNKLLTQRRPWLPMPLLGIPNWAHLPQNSAFYADQGYFMPKPEKRNN